MNIKSICLTLEAGVGHRTIPMLLAKSSFYGDVKDWSTLINLHSKLDLEVKQLNNHRIYTTTAIIIIIINTSNKNCNDNTESNYLFTLGFFLFFCVRFTITMRSWECGNHC